MTEAAEKPEVDTVAQDLRGKLLTRLAVAGGLVAVLLGVLAFFDHLANPPDEVEAPVFTKPIPVAPRKEVSQPVTPTESLPEPPAAAPAEPAVEPPPPPVVEEQPAVPTVTPPTKGSARSPAPPAPPAAAKKPVSAPTPVPEATSAPNNIPPARPDLAPAEPEPARPAAAARETRPAPPVNPPSGAARLFSGFLLQAGVFSSVQHAEELSARLNQSGVKATLETRVQVGPFRTRQEAEAAQAKLRQLGVETIIVPPRGKSQ